MILTATGTYFLAVILQGVPVVDQCKLLCNKNEIS